jgi:integrase
MTPSDPPSSALIPPTSNTLATLDQPDAVHPVLAYLAGLASDRSRRVMRDDLALIAALLLGVDPDSVSPDDRRRLVFEVPWHELRIAHTNLVRARLLERGLAANTINRMLSALRGVLKACWQGELMSAEEYHRARAVEAVQGHTLPAGRDLGNGERAALFDTCASDPTPAGARDAALLACADAGLRRGEICRLDLADYDRDTHRLVVHGKGNKERYVPLNDGQGRAIEDWLAVRGQEPGPLLWPVNKGGNLSNRRLTSQAVYNAMQKRGQEAGVQDFSPHDFRRTLVGDLLDAGADIATVQKIMGHADPATTARYDRRSEQAKHKAANLRHTPYKGRKQEVLPAD